MPVAAVHPSNNRLEMNLTSPGNAVADGGRSRKGLTAASSQPGGTQQTPHAQPIRQRTRQLRKRRRSQRGAPRQRPKIKWTLDTALSISHTLIRPEAEEFFIANCRAAIVGWISLLQNTTLDTNSPISGLKIKSALKFLDNIITNPGGTGLPAKFGYVRLLDFFECLEDRIRTQRERGLFQGKPGEGDATVAINACISAMEGGWPPSKTRSWLKEGKRFSIRWKRYAGESEFLLLIYSDAAEATVYVG